MSPLTYSVDDGTLFILSHRIPSLSVNYKEYQRHRILQPSSNRFTKTSPRQYSNVSPITGPDVRVGFRTDPDLLDEGSSECTRRTDFRRQVPMYPEKEVPDEVTGPCCHRRGSRSPDSLAHSSFGVDENTDSGPSV